MKPNSNQNDDNTQYDQIFTHMKYGTLYLIPLPISEDFNVNVTPRQVEVIESCKYFLVENIRTARRFISSLKLDVAIDQLHFDLLDKRTASASIKELMRPLLLGNDLGLMSEAGSPCVADPGALAVAFAHSNQIKVVPLAGPSSIILGLIASGLNGQSFTFHGYLPIKKDERIKMIKKIESLSRSLDQTQIFIEAPYRNQSLFEDLLKTCKKETLLCVAMDINGQSEWIQTLSISQWMDNNANFTKNPAIYLILA